MSTLAAKMSNRDRLLLSQAVYQEGEQAWAKVAALMSQYAPANGYTPDSCQSAYAALTAELDNGVPRAAPPRAVTPQSRAQLKLARTYYQARIDDLKTSIRAEEVLSRRHLKDAADIHNGLWDDKIKALLPETVFKPAAPEASTSTPVVSSDGPVSPGARKKSPDRKTSPVVPPASARKSARRQSADANAVVQEADPDPPEPPSLTKRHSSRIRSDPDTRAGPSIGQTAESIETEAIQEILEDEEDDTLRQGEDILEGGSEQSGKPRSGRSTRSSAAAPIEIISDAGGSDEEEDADHSSSPQKRSRNRATRLGTRRTSTRGKPDTDGQEEDASVKDEQEDAEDEDEMPARRGSRVKSETQPARGASKRKRNPTPQTEPSPAPSDRSKKRAKTDESEEMQVTPEKDRASAKRFQRSILQIHTQIVENPKASVFREPVKQTDAPGYSALIKEPMSLKGITKRIRDGTITNSIEFRRDITLMFANAIMYNPKDSEVARQAQAMLQEAEALIGVYDQAEAFA
ncbi:uncharacterized protein L969DRAFT_96532 [Mixia osmundae IAM 14324]|uniref:Bromo domain-containing protein n=1 Tax=Mixia osmundae (strain CBS 9802 / IAM 14324 / JCM 22182 / KY 12970) TaxID=764103 RepID=G7DUR9_MIXOS|nr:uncharacterized protein L969DRAFT_96532 [Mixia osmundae IAM 14324]KEI37453.1 hypothetical protein L969DRAFT_96532 [Mixia osmundae IAM 14324]GAA94329.1 hypothetical protein E5Q_00980 [Mixia osmundae IAM 14324]